MNAQEIFQMRRMQAEWFAYGAGLHAAPYRGDSQEFGMAFAMLGADHDAGGSSWMPSIADAFKLWYPNGSAIPALFEGEPVLYRKTGMLTVARVSPAQV